LLFQELTEIIIKIPFGLLTT